MDDDDKDRIEDIAEAFAEARRNNPCFDLVSPPNRAQLLDDLRVIDEARASLRMHGYEEWAEMLAPVITLLNVEVDQYPEEAEECEERS